MKDYIKLLRPKHYLKNVLVLLPLFFSGDIFQWEKLLTAVCGFFAFSLISSVVYIINDIRDVEKDRKHPQKRNRPIASGRVSVKMAIVLAVVASLFAVGFHGFASGFSLLASLYILLYFALNLAYSLGLKKQPIIDIVILSSGFLLRVLYGGAIIDVVLSQWLYLTVVTLSFYMGLGKRRGEFAATSGETVTRDVLGKYSYEFLDKNMNVCLTLGLVFYSLWTVDPSTIDRVGGNALIWTIPIVLIICMKYSLTIERNDNDSDGDPITVLFSDRLLIVLVLIYGLLMCGILYGPLVLQLF